MRIFCVQITIIGLTLMSAVSCGPAVTPPQDRTVVPDQPTPLPTAGVLSSPPASASRFFTAVPITQTEPSMVKDKTPMNVNPIPMPADPGMQNLVKIAQGDLAKRLGITASQIELITAESVVWPDGGLGCPQPGMLYTQVQVDGVLIRLRADGRVYEYHSGGNRPPFLCEK